MNKVIITMLESEYQSLVISKALDNTPHYVSILPNVENIENTDGYKERYKMYKKAKYELNKFIFNETTNK